MTDAGNGSKEEEAREHKPAKARTARRSQVRQFLPMISSSCHSSGAVLLNVGPFFLFPLANTGTAFYCQVLAEEVQFVYEG